MLCHLLPHEVRDGPGNMALDEALLDAAAEDPATAAFRTYVWTVPTLSLGYFQRMAEVEADPRWRGVPLVRRPTGGGAIWHHRELTYALALPRSHPLAHRAADLYHAVHATIVDALRERGIPAERRGTIPLGRRPARPFLCFEDRDAEDVVVRGAKVVGSAQRRRRGAVLQHGSLLLACSEMTPDLPGIGDLADVLATAAPWSDLVRRRVPEGLGFAIHPRDVSDQERERAAALAVDVHGNPAWIRRR